MSTYRELINMVSDLAKQVSDDSTLTHNHIAFLLNKYRTYLLKQKYNNKAQEIPTSNYQTICSKLEYLDRSNATLNNCCENVCHGDSSSYILRSKDVVTEVLSFSDTDATLLRCAGEYGLRLDGSEDVDWDNIQKYLGEIFNVHPFYIYGLPYNIEKEIYSTRCREDVTNLVDILKKKFPIINASVYTISDSKECNENTLYNATVRSYGNVQMVSRDRFSYVGIGKFNKRYVYGTIGIDNHLYIKSSQDISVYTTALVTSLFEEPDKAYEQSSCKYTRIVDGVEEEYNCPDSDGKCDPWDRIFPLEDALQTALINLVLKDILGAVYRPSDSINNAADDLSNIQNFVRQNMKQQYVNQQVPQDIE